MHISRYISIFAIAIFKCHIMSHRGKKCVYTNFMKKNVTIYWNLLKKYIFLILLIGFAQEKVLGQVNLNGYVLDCFTKTGVKAKVKLCENGKTIDSVETRIVRNNAFYRFRVPATKHKYIIKVSSEGYIDTTIVYEIKHIARNTSFSVPDILLEKDFNSDIYKSVDIDGIEVKGTQIRFAYRGDTLVYNASAFKIPSGSMLQDLVKQLPGSELKTNGDIYINGKKIDYLTLNGRDLFKGKNKLLLHNLPYYTIKELKVFETENEESQLKGYAVDKKDYVMDISLKHEYITGIISNITIGAGTKDRYLGRIFGLRNTHHSALSVYANMDNANAGALGNGSDWKPSDMGGALRVTKEVGLDLNIRDAGRKWTEKLSANIGHNKNTQEEETLRHEQTTVQALDQNTTNSSFDNNNSFNLSNRFRLMKPFVLNTITKLSFFDSEGSSLLFRSSQSNKESKSNAYSHRRFTLSGSADYMTKMPTGDDLCIMVEAQMGRNTPHYSNNRDSISYSLLDSIYKRSEFIGNTSDNYDYTTTAHYIMHFQNHITLFYKLVYQQTYRHADNHYEIDNRCDDFNSHSFENMARKYSAICGVSYYNESENGMKNISISFPLTYTDEFLRFHSNQFANNKTRNYHNFLPNLYVEITRNGYIFNANANIGIVPPDMTDIIPVINNFDPLYVYKSNPMLKNSLQGTGNIGIGHTKHSTGRSWSLRVHANTIQDAIGRYMLYDSQTGQSTCQKANVDATNYDWGTAFNLHLNWGKKRAISTDFNTDMSFVHNVDYEIGHDIPTTKLSSVNSRLSKTSLTTKYSYKNFFIDIKGDFLWRYTSSQRKDFSNINAYEYHYGTTLQQNIPTLDMSISTDINIFSRRGYNLADMNTNDVIWNASINYGIIKKKLACKLTAFDILHQISNKKMNIDAQGYTETIIHSMIPNYIMLSLTYFIK